ncbi:hypothetical protein D3C72_2393670 [compost metagenome]
MQATSGVVGGLATVVAGEPDTLPVQVLTQTAPVAGKRVSGGEVVFGLSGQGGDTGKGHE